MARKANTPIDVWKYIRMPPDGDEKPCWEWTGTYGGREGDKRGYFTISGVKYLAYRVVYELVHGPLADGQVVRHGCDNPRCCNPHHLTKGTQSDNEHDKYDRGRYGFPLAVVNRIVNLGHTQMSQVAISAIVEQEFGLVVSQQRCSDIIRGVRRARQTALVRSKLKREAEKGKENGEETAS